MKKLMSLFSNNKWLFPAIRMFLYGLFVVVLASYLEHDPDILVAFEFLETCDSSVLVASFGVSFISILVIAIFKAFLECIFFLFLRKSGDDCHG